MCNLAVVSNFEGSDKVKTSIQWFNTRETWLAFFSVLCNDILDYVVA